MTAERALFSERGGTRSGASPQPTPMSDMELKMSIQPIEELLAERAVIVRELADLRARFGSFGTWDHLRKVELSRLKGLIRALATRHGRKMNNEQVDEEAHAHPDYIDFITAATMQRARWVKLEADMEEIEMKVNRGQAVARFASAEARL